MDAGNLLLTEPVQSPYKLEDLSSVNPQEEEQKVEMAKKFEAVFINKLLEEMTKTIGDWGSEHDGASKQIQGLFTFCLSEDMGKKGGLGLWKEIYESFDTKKDIVGNNEMDIVL